MLCRYEVMELLNYNTCGEKNVVLNNKTSYSDILLESKSEIYAKRIILRHQETYLCDTSLQSTFCNALKGSHCSA